MEMLNIMKFWLQIGIDGFRVDAVPFLFEEEGTTCESLPQTHEFLKEMRSFVESINPNAILLCEACQPPAEVRSYFGNGDEFHMGFHFPVMPYIFLSIKSGDYTSLKEVMAETPEIPPNCQWVTFLRNHDELTLEMVKPHERQYMWKEYAPIPRMKLNLGIRRRLTPLMDNDRRKIELAYSMLFTLPGSPIIYYGDEIGMGDNIYLPDRNGVRTPMQWESSNPSAGFSISSNLYAPLVTDPLYSKEIVNVKDVVKDPGSLFNIIRNMILTRRKHQSFGSGTFDWIDCTNKSIGMYIRNAGFDKMLVVLNLSNEIQSIDFPLPNALLPKYMNNPPYLLEVLTNTKVPVSEENLIQLRLEPYRFLWLSAKFTYRRCEEFPNYTRSLSE